MIDVGLYFDSGKISTALSALLELPAPIRPVFFSEEEGKVESRNNRVDDRKRFDEFRRAHPEGFFLLNDECMWDISHHPKKFWDDALSSVFLGPINEDSNIQNEIVSSSASLVMSSLKGTNPLFGYAADTKERHHRNRIFVQKDANKIESWVGRDMRKYLPGLYWMTLISNRLISKHQLNVGVLRQEAIDFATLESDEPLYFFQFFENPVDWEEQAIRLDKLCAKERGIFSMTDVYPSAIAAKNYEDLDMVLSNFK